MVRILGLLFSLLAAFGIAMGDDALARLGAAEQLFAEERYEEAAHEYEAALRADAGLEQSRQQLAICLFETRDYDRARPLFNELALRQRSARLAQYYLGRLDLATGKPDLSIRHLRAVVGPQPFRDEHYFLGSAYYKLDRLPTAAQFLRQAIVLNPRDSRAHQLLARIYRKTGRAVEAEREFAETRRLSQYYLEGSAALKRCSLALSKGDAGFAEACRPLTESDDVDKLSAVGVILGKAEHHAEAKTVLEKAVALDPDSSELHYNLALSWFYLNLPEDARKHAAAALAIRPDFPEANVLYGTVLYLSGADEEALPVLRRANRLRPDDANVRKLLGEELMRAADRTQAAGKLKEAEEHLKEASRIMPDSPDVAQRLLALQARRASAPLTRR